MLDAIWAILLELAPWLLLGAAIAGLLHALLPADFVRRHLRGRGSVAKAVALGVPLPLCSCGVIPAGLGLRKDGASRGAAVGFLVSTPQTGVDSILVTSSFLGWPFALFKVAAAAVTGWVAGVLSDRLGGDEPEPSPVVSAPPVASVAPRWRAAFDHAAEVLHTIWGWLAVGVLVSAALTVWVPASVWSQATAYGTAWTMAAVLALSVPLYVCATASVPIAAALVAGGFPPGAALVFLMAGPATNVATIGAVHRTLGGRVLAIYLGTIVVGSIGLGWAFDFLLARTAVTMPEHADGAAWWSIASAVVLVAALAAFAVADLRAWWRGRRPASGAVHRIEIEGMTCGGCARRVADALHGVDGVTGAVVDHAAGLATVHGDASEATLREAVRQAGYRPVGP